MIDGSYWLGAAAGTLLTLPLLDPTLVDPAIGWRLPFGLGGTPAIMILIVRRHVPESPRWLFIHGREEAAEKIVQGIEKRVTTEDQVDLEPVDETITVRQRRTIGMGLIAKTVFTLYPRRTILCFALFVGQAFLYDAFFFTYGLLHLRRHPHHVPGRGADRLLHRDLRGQQLRRRAAAVPIVRHSRPEPDDRRHVFALRRAAGDHRPAARGLSAVTLTLAGAIIFFFASAGASSAYLTASEIFPMETRALCIAFFYAIGTAAGGIAGPLLFGSLIGKAAESGGITGIAPGYSIGATSMIIGGLIAAFLAVDAQNRSLEDIAQPLTTADADS